VQSRSTSTESVCHRPESDRPKLAQGRTRWRCRSALTARDVVPLVLFRRTTGAGPVRNESKYS
jgi:hypothetical protein